MVALVGVEEAEVEKGVRGTRRINQGLSWVRYNDRLLALCNEDGTNAYESEVCFKCNNSQRTIVIP
jgi:hypothetical protein